MVERSAERVAGPRLTVLSWNVWSREDITRCVDLICELDPDVVCLQELVIRDGTDEHGPRYVAQRLGYDFCFKEIDVGESELVLANGVFSRWPITRSRVEWINEPRGSGHYDDQYRAYLEASLDVGPAPVTVATTHMSYTNGFEETTRKAGETAKLVELITGRNRRFVLTGDLNAGPRSTTITAVSRVLTDVGPRANTWTTKPFSYDGFTETELAWQLDYVFASSDATVHEARVIDTALSDHLPVLVELEFA